jgi:hypothetical protein
VHRYNNYRAAILPHHGTGSGVRSTRQFEIYENDFTGSTGCANTVDATGCGGWDLNGNTPAPVVGSRGGVGIVFNNRLTTTNGTAPTKMLAVVNERMPGLQFDDQAFGACSGSNVWDQNTPGQNGRLCIDQPGAGYGDLVATTSGTPGCSAPFPKNVTRGCTQEWPNQVAQPNYEWGNTINGAAVTACQVDNTTGTTSVINGTDCIHGERPGYTPYTYPHPLTLDAYRSKVSGSLVTSGGGAMQ